MHRGSESDRLPEPQATVWPPPPNVPFVAPAADPHHQEALASQRCLRAGVFLFVGGCLSPFVVLLLSLFVQNALHLHLTPSPVLLRYLWPGFYLAATYFGGRTILLARTAQSISLQVQGFIITSLSVLFTCLSWHLLSL